MHKSEQYGTILLKQKYKQNESICLNFAIQISKHTPYSVDEITAALTELVENGVCMIDGDVLIQKRMVNDNRISELRSKAGKKGGGNPTFVKTNDDTLVSSFVKTKSQTNSEYEYENEVEDKNKEIGGTGERESLVVKYHDFKSPEEMIDNMHNDWNWQTKLLKTNPINAVQYRKAVFIFVTERWETDCQKPLKDVWYHFTNWIAKNIKRLQTEQNGMEVDITPSGTKVIKVNRRAGT